MNQVPKPYKPPSSNLKAKKVDNFPSSPEYSNVKKASLASKNSAVSAKISQFSSHGEKPAMSPKPQNKKVDHSKSSISPRKSPTSKAEVTKKTNGTLNKDIKQDQLKSDGSLTKLGKQNGSVINKSKPTISKTLQNPKPTVNQTKKSPTPAKVTLSCDLTPALQKDVASDKPAFVVHVDRSSQKKVSVMVFLQFPFLIYCPSLEHLECIFVNTFRI